MADNQPSQQGSLSPTAVVVVGIVLLVIFVLSIAAAVRWLPDPNPAWMNASNYGVGIWGLFISVVGFGLTLWQLYITKRAAQQALEAADSARIRLNAFSALRECEAGKRQFDLISEAIEGEKWEKIVALSQPLANSLLSLGGSNATLDPEVVQAIDRARSLIDRNCETIDKAVSLDRTRLSKAKQFTAFRPINHALTMVYFNIERLS